MVQKVPVTDPGLERTNTPAQEARLETSVQIHFGRNRRLGVRTKALGASARAHQLLLLALGEVSRILDGVRHCCQSLCL